MVTSSNNVLTKTQKGLTRSKLLCLVLPLLMSRQASTVGECLRWICLSAEPIICLSGKTF